ncbi:MAG: hypothetical protein RL017_892 [Pseudomonadota bacterium]|jgi:hypothetical protein
MKNLIRLILLFIGLKFAYANQYAYVNSDNGDAWIGLNACVINETGDISSCANGQEINPEKDYLLSNISGGLYKTSVSGADMAEYNNYVYIPYFTLDYTTITINAYGVLKCSHQESDGYLSCSTTYLESDVLNIKMTGLTINNGIAYISNLYNLPYQCNIDKNGDFILPCKDNQNTSNYIPIELTINQDSTMALGIDINSNILSCNLNSSHDINSCQKVNIESVSIPYPQQVAFYGNYIYIADGSFLRTDTQAYIYKCTFNNDDSLNCQSIFNQYQGISFGTAFTGIMVDDKENTAYITENSLQGYGALWLCPIKTDGTFATKKCKVNKSLYGITSKTVVVNQ